MSLQLYIAESLNDLSAKLAEDINKGTQRVFATRQIVTQTEGVNSWLRMQLAEKNGITANTHFLQVQELVYGMYTLLSGDSRKMLDQEALRWQLFYLLGEEAFTDRFKVVADYYLMDDVKRIALAEKLADVFDQYQMYRPKVIEEWNKMDLQNIAQDNWQAWLWIQMKSKLRDNFIDKTTLIGELIRLLGKGEKLPLLKEKYPRVLFFGIAIITPFYFELYNALAGHIDLVFYLTNPAPDQYWMDHESEKNIAKIYAKRNRHLAFPEKKVPAGNELLHNWGKLLKDSFYILFGAEEISNTFEVLTSTGDGSKIPEHDWIIRDESDRKAVEGLSLLDTIKMDIRYNVANPERRFVSKQQISDGSIRFASNFTPVREVESLYNYLVELVDKKKLRLSPREIVVSVTDIDLYAPFIKAVFDNAPYKIPYAIADESITAGNNLFTALQALLAFDAEQFTAESVLELLDSPLICERMGITDKELIRSVLRSAGIRFGWEGNKEQETHYFSWKYGLEKIQLGLCIAGGALYHTEQHELEPLDQVEGQDAFTLIPFLYFVDILHKLLEKRNTARTLDGWVQYVQELVDTLIMEEADEDEKDFAYLVRQLGKLLEISADKNEPIDFQVFSYSFLQFLEKEKKAHRFISKGVTFCSMVPMRSIPFRVVALLGMDFDKFPRKDARLSFSLIEQDRLGGKSLRGDRSTKDNDKHLFLESMLSAREYFYVSYIGNSVKEGTEKPPSALVDELIDYIYNGLNEDDRTSVSRKELVTRHPLYSFSLQYGTEVDKLINYLDDTSFRTSHQVEKAGEVTDANEIKEGNKMRIVKLDDLLSFYRNPLRWFLNKAHGVYYREEDLLLPDTEPFELDKLQEWAIRDTLMTNNEMQNNAWEETDEDFRKQMARNGKLPLKNYGAVYLREQYERIEQIQKMVNDAKALGEHAPMEMSLELDDYHRLEGTEKEIYGSQLVLYGISSNYRRDIMLAFIRYVAVVANGNECVSLSFFHEDPENNFTIEVGKLDRNWAQKLLADLIRSFHKGSDECFPFFMDLPDKDKSLKIILDQTYEEFIDDIESRLEKEEDVYKDYTVSDPYFLRIWENSIMESTWYKQYQSNMKAFDEILTKFKPDFS